MYVCKIYIVIVNRSLTMITSYIEVVNLHYVVIGVVLALSVQFI